MEKPAFELTERLRPKWFVTGNSIPGGKLFVDAEARMSATPDAFIVDPDRPGKRGVLQVKSVERSVFERTWKQDGEIEVPIAVAIQAICDATLSGADYAYAGAFVVGFGIDYHLLEVPLHAGLMARAREFVKDFWRRVAADDPYPADYGRDGDVIRALYDRDDEPEVDLSGNDRAGQLLADRESLKVVESAATQAIKERKRIDTELIALLGNAARGRVKDGRIIEAKVTRKDEYKVKATSYRTIRIKEVKNEHG